MLPVRSRFSLNLPPAIVPLFFGIVMIEASYGAFLGVYPLFIEQLGAPIAWIGVMLSVGGFLRLLLLAPSAPMADRIGYRRMILLCRTASVIGFILAALAQQWWQLAFFIVLNAIGELFFPLVQAVVASETTGEERMRSFALIFNVGPSIAMAISPLASGLLVHFYGLRAAFLLAALTSAIGLFLLRTMHEPADIGKKGEVEEADFITTVRNPMVRRIGLMLLVTVFTMSLGSSFTPTFLENVRGIDAATIASLGALSALGSSLFGIAVARMTRLQRSPLIAAAVAVTLTAISFQIFRLSPLLLLIALGFFLRGGFFSSWAMINASMGQYAEPQFRTRSFVLLEMIGGVAYSFGPLVAAQLYKREPTSPFQLATLFCIILIPVFYLVQRRINAYRAAHPIVIETIAPAEGA